MDPSSPGARAASSPGTWRRGGASRSRSTTGPIRAGRRGSPPSCAACTCPPRSSSSAARSSGIRTSCAACTAQGFELGNHTFTHADVSTLPGWEQRLQIGLTDNALAGTVGIRPRLFRPPYSSAPGGVSAAPGARLRTARPRRLRHRADRLSTARTGAARGRRDRRLRHAAGPARRHRPAPRRRRRPLADRRGGQRIVPALRARGFRFVTVSQLAGLRATRGRGPGRPLGPRPRAGS